MGRGNNDVKLKHVKLKNLKNLKMHNCGDCGKLPY